MQCIPMFIFFNQFSYVMFLNLNFPSSMFDVSASITFHGFLNNLMQHRSPTNLSTMHFIYYMRTSQTAASAQAQA